MDNRERSPILLGLIFLLACGSPTNPSDPSAVNAAPTAEIQAPTDGADFTEGDTIVFEGSASDPEDGELTGESLVWKSRLDGEIGIGKTNEVFDLSVGIHTVTLTGTDSESATASDEVVVEVQELVRTPSVELTAKLPRPDLDPSKTLEIADGEAVKLSWFTENEPTECVASGGWSGNKSVNGDTVTTDGLSGPADLEYVLRCENSAGASADTVSINVAAPGERHAVSNRPDETDARQVKFFYVTCEGCQDREMDLDGTLENNFEKFQDLFFEETGERFRVDTYVDGDGTERFDITFMVVDTTKGLSINDVMRKEMKRRDLYKRPENGGVWTLIRYYSGPQRFAAGGWANEVLIRDGDDRQPNPELVGHELLHSLYLVDKDAPNADDEHHVTDHDYDLLDNTPGKPFSEEFIIDHNRDDYYCPDGCGEDVENLYGHPTFINP